MKEKRSEYRLMKQVGVTCRAFELLAPRDKILVAISGGKDSYTLLHLLRRLKEKLPFEIDLVAVHLDQRQPGYDGSSLVAWLEREKYAFEILSEDTYSVVMKHVEPGGTYCSLCSRLRRGILYGA